MLTTGTALALASVALVGYDMVTYRATLVRSLSILTKVVGENSIGALTFGDSGAALDALAVLRAEPQISTACIYDQTRGVFAEYHRTRSESGSCPIETVAPGDRYQGHLFGVDEVTFVRPIAFDEQNLGSVYVQADLRELQSRLIDFGGTTLIILLVSSVVVIVLSIRFQRVITGPIFDLAEIARAVSVKKNYSIRAEKHAQDEIGQLVDGFNGMLETVQERDMQLTTANKGLAEEVTERKRAVSELREAHETLELRVKERTAELERQRANLACLAGDLRVARDEARAADRAKSEFLAAMSHELRTPLHAVIGFSEIIKHETIGPVGNPKYQEYAGDILESGQHLLGLINDILDLAKIESGKDKLDEDEIDTPDIIRSALKLVGHRAEQDGVKLELELADQVSALRADKRKLKQILINLLSNAVKFTDAGGTVTLRAWCQMNSGYVFQIVDTGIGIAPENIPKALSRFGQVDSYLNRRYEGTGLGLPLTKALVEQHGGTLDLQSEVSVGTTVTVRFPAERIVHSQHETQTLGTADKQAS